MNGKKAKSLRRKAYNLFMTMKEDIKKRVSLRKVYKHLKKEYKKRIN